MTIETYKADRSSGLSADSAFEPQSFEAALNVCRTLVASGMFGRDTKPEALLVKVLAGRELGLTVMQSARSIYAFESQGRLVVGLDASLVVAKVQRHPDVEHLLCVDTTNTQATWELQVRGREPRRYTYTIDMARIAGLVDKPNWKAHPAAMLRARAVTALVRMEFPEATMGFVSTDEAEEIRDSYDGTPAPRRAVVTVADSQPAQTPPRVVDVVPEPVADLSEWRKRFADCASLADLETLRKSVPTELQKPLIPDYKAAKARLSPKDDGPKGGSKPVTEQTNATGSGEHAQANDDGARASAESITLQWINHLRGHDSPQHVIASCAKHLDEFPETLHERIVEATINRLRGFEAWARGRDLDAELRAAFESRAAKIAKGA